MDPTRLTSLLTDALSSIVSIGTSFFFLITILLFMSFDANRYPALLATARNTHPRMIDSLAAFAHGTRVYLVVSTIFGLIVAVIDGIALYLLDVPAPAAWAVLAFVTNYVPNIGFVIGLIPPAALALLDGGPSKMLAVIAAYSVINFIIQSVIQPKFVGDAVGLTGTITIVSLVFWAVVLGPLGALLAIPLSLLVRAVLVDSDERADWIRPLLSGYPTPDPPVPATDSTEANTAETPRE